jgi:hypothetical protein
MNTQDQITALQAQVTQLTDQVSSLQSRLAQMEKKQEDEIILYEGKFSTSFDEYKLVLTPTVLRAFRTRRVMGDEHEPVLKYWYNAAEHSVVVHKRKHFGAYGNPTEILVLKSNGDCAAFTALGYGDEFASQVTTQFGKANWLDFRTEGFDS